MKPATAADRLRLFLDDHRDCDHSECPVSYNAREVLLIALEALEYYEARITLKCAREAIERMAEVLEGK